MRNAPKWRAFLPTGREIRHGALNALARAFPTLAARANLYMTPCDWAATRSRPVAAFEMRSSQTLTEEERAFYQKIFRTEHARCSGQIHENAVWRYEIDEFADAVVLGNSGQSALPGAACAVTRIFKDTSKPTSLAGSRQDGACVNFLHHRDGMTNYYHLLVDRCSMMLDVLSAVADQEPQITILTRRNTAQIEDVFLTGLMARFPNLQIRRVGNTEKVECERLLQHRVTVNCGYRSPHSTEVLARVSEVFEDAYGIDPSPPRSRRLLISREDARIRHALNERDLFASLEPLGFERICPGKLSHKDQISAFKQAECIVGVHGAGLTNIMFMQSGARVIEIFSEDYCQGAYMWLSKLRSVDYVPIVCSGMLAHQNFTIDPENMDRIVALASGA